jgi:hypothetical protein
MLLFSSNAMDPSHSLAGLKIVVNMNDAKFGSQRPSFLPTAV